MGTGSAGFVYSLTGLCAPQWFVYGLFPLVVVSGLHYAPFAYIFIGGILRNMDANLEEAATILKSSKRRILLRITLPIVKPAILSTFLLVFASVMGSYAVPIYLGSPVNFYVLTTKMKTLQTTAIGQAYIIALFMVVLGALIMLFNNVFTGSRKSYTTVTGKSSQISLVDLKAGKYIVAGILCAILFFVCIMPLISFGLESVIIKAGDYSPSNMTLNYWIGDAGSVSTTIGNSGILKDPAIWSAMGNSLKLSVICALIAGSCGVIIGYAVVRRRGTKLSAWVSGLSFFPYLVPAMAFSAIYLEFPVSDQFLPDSGTGGIREVSSFCNESRNQLHAAALSGDRRGSSHLRCALDPQNDADHHSHPEDQYYLRIPASVRILYERTVPVRHAGKFQDPDTDHDAHDL